MSSICKCGAIATTLVEYEDGEVEPVCEACFQAKKEWAEQQDKYN